MSNSLIYDKVINFFYKYFHFLLILMILVFFSLGFYFIWSIKEREIELNLEEITGNIEAVWKSVTSAHEETMNSYFMHYVMDPKTLRILKKANSSDERQQNLARAELFKHLWYHYKYLRDNQLVRQFHFHLPNNRSFLRFHAPESYGDDLTNYRPTIALTNKLKKPHIGFETGRIVSGYRYVYPIIDKEGNHLGSVEISRPFEILRRALKNIFEKKGFVLILREKDVMPKLLPGYEKYYFPVPFAKGWLLEDPFGELPDSSKPIEEEYQRVLEAQSKNKDFLNMLEDESNSTLFISHEGKYYTITSIKLKELDKTTHSAVLLTIVPSEEIDLIEYNFKKNLALFTFLIFSVSVVLYLYVKQTIKIREKQNELDAITSSMGSGILVIDKRGLIQFLNNSALKILGYEEEKELIGSIAHYKIHKHDTSLTECPLFGAVSSGKNYCSDEVFIRKDGSEVYVYVVSRPLFIYGELKGAVIVFTDINERKEMEKQLYTLSISDTLTSLYNRRYQLEMLRNAKNKADRYGEPFSILMIDIDNFKSINDQYGHNMGDLVLKKVSNIFIKNVRASDIVSRWGGEEFLILLPNTQLDGALTIAERIRSQVEAINIETLPKITVSIGVTSYKISETIEKLISRADKALYEAKISGKNNVKVLEN
ncbi:MAG: diguanylate cyclase [Thermodesulfovibrio sp.]|nr:diguanylate cyclase [Thermodesulfovibrio sp.]